MQHGIRSAGAWGQGDPAHVGAGDMRGVGAWHHRDTTGHGLAAAVVFLFLSLFALPALAQAPASLRVAARVVATAPSREALTAALQPEPGLRNQPLAQIHRRLLPGGTDSLGVARRPSAVVTIAFLNN